MDVRKVGKRVLFCSYTNTLSHTHAHKHSLLQMILNCVPNTDKCGGTGGCFGGTTELAFGALAKTYNGLASEWTFP